MKAILIGSSLLIVALAALRAAFGKSLSRRVQYALWALVVLRLLIPAGLTFERETAAPEALTAPAMPVSAALSAERETAAPAASPASLASAAAETAAQSRPSRSTDVSAILNVVWIMGMAAMGAYLTAINIRFYLALVKGRALWQTEPGGRRIWLAEGLSSPCAFGRSIYLTPAAVRSPETLRHVLAHEKTHLRHLDPLWAFLRCVCLAVYWFDPLVWLAAHLSRVDCELACDEGTLARLEEGERLSYGETLLSLIPMQGKRTQPFLAATTMSGDKKRLAERVKRIAFQPVHKRSAALIATAAACAFALGAFVQAENAPSERALTAQEIERVNRAFEQVVVIQTREGERYEAAPTNGFFSSHYADPREMDLGEFLAYFPVDPRDTPVTEAEFQALRALPGFPFRAETLENMIVPVKRHRRKDVDAALQKYAGITSADISDTDGLLYLEQTDSWYNFTSDFGAGYFNCVSGKVYGGSVAVLTGNVREDGRSEQLTLVKENGQWHIRAFKAVSGERELTAEEIAQVNAAFQQILSAETAEGARLYVNPVLGFFLSEYSETRDMDFQAFLAYFPHRPGDEPVDEAEFQALRARYSLPFAADTLSDMPLPVHRHRRADVDEALMKYAGITSDALSDEGLLYLTEYDAWYDFTSDFGAGYFNCAGGTVYWDEMAVLRGNYAEDGSFDKLLLVKEGDAWHIKAFQRMAE